MKINWVSVASIRTPHHDEVSRFNFLITRCSSTCSEDCGQTDHAGSVSSSITGVDVVGTNYGTRKLLHHEIQFIGRLGAREESNGVWAVGIFDRLKTGGCTGERFVPRRCAQNTVVAHHWLGDSSQGGVIVSLGVLLSTHIHTLTLVQ